MLTAHPQLEYTGSRILQDGVASMPAFRLLPGTDPGALVIPSPGYADFTAPAFSRCSFSDERQNATYSQFIGEMLSKDGGLTWSANPDGSTNTGAGYSIGGFKAVASTNQADRPGMATVAQIGATNRYVMSYELCGPLNCEAHTKSSLTGDFWERARRT